MFVAATTGTIGGPFSEGAKTNPADTTVLADTTALAAGTYEVRAIVCNSDAIAVDLETRNAANNARVGNAVTVRLYSPSASEYVWTFVAAVNQRIRAIVNGSPTAIVHVTLGTRLLDV